MRLIVNLNIGAIPDKQESNVKHRNNNLIFSLRLNNKIFK